MVAASKYGKNHKNRTDTFITPLFISRCACSIEQDGIHSEPHHKAAAVFRHHQPNVANGAHTPLLLERGRPLTALGLPLDTTRKAGLDDRSDGKRDQISGVHAEQHP